MKKLFIFILLVVVSVSYSQQKYFIYFKDKGLSASLQKNSLSYQNALNTLSAHAIQRRTKLMNPDSIITYEDLPINDSYVEELKSIGIKIENKLNWFNAVTAVLNKNQLDEISKLSFVQKINPVKVLTFKIQSFQNNILPKTLSSDVLDYGNSFDQLQLSDVPLVHSKGITGEGIIIGILDTGFRWKQHESLENRNVLNEYDFVFHDSVTANQANDRADQDSHGTYVFSVVGGYKDSTMIGPAYNASFLLAKTEDVRSETHVEEDNYAAALEWMEAQGVDITTSSLGYNEFDSGNSSYTYSDMNGKTAIVTRAAELAFQRGVVTITAAGNEGNKPWHYILAPADGFNILAVGAVYNDNLVASFSSRGPTYDGRIKPDVVAMGVDVYGASTTGFDKYSYSSGTSAATPIAAGVAGLLLSAYPYLSNVQVRNILQETSDNSADPDNDRGYGLISAANSISFPNIQSKNGNFILHKAFVDSFNVNNVQLNYSTDNNNYFVTNMVPQNDFMFTEQLPLFQLNQLIYFYFTYKDSLGNLHREPEINNYKLHYGNLLVSLNLNVSSVATNYVLSNNYPNPFNSYTKIDFIANGNYPAEFNCVRYPWKKSKNSL